MAEIGKRVKCHQKKFLIASRSTLINPSHFQFEIGQSSVGLWAYYQGP